MTAGRPIAVIDIDGVLADATHRQHHLEQRPRNWGRFFAEVGDDPVIPAGRDLLRVLAVDHDVVLLSGRPESTRAATVAWLDRQGISAADVILRADGDYRTAAVLKAELIGGIGDPGHVDVVVDDDQAVVERLATMGYRTRLFG